MLSAMDFEDVVRKRGMVRAFKPDLVEDATVQKILRHAWKAPSAGNTQPVEFIIVKDPEVKEDLARAALNQTFIAEAPVVIAVCSNTKRSAAVYGSRGINFYSIIDGAFAAMTILLSAVNEGLGCCFVAAFHDEQVSRVLGLPSYIRPIGLMPLGYRAERPARVPRIPLKKLVHYDRW